MQKRKEIAMGCGGGCLKIILLPILLIGVTAAVTFLVNSSGWRANVYTYDSQWIDGDSWRWADGQFLLWHGEESFILVHQGRLLADEEIIRDNIERIGRIRPLPVLTEENPDNNYFRTGFVYAVDGLDPGDWLYVIYAVRHNLIHMGYRHRIYISTNLIMDNPLGFLEEHFGSLESISP